MLKIYGLWIMVKTLDCKRKKSVGSGRSMSSQSDSNSVIY